MLILARRFFPFPFPFSRLDAELVFEVPRLGIDVAELLFHVVGGDFEVAVA
ncbi:MAG TPA: hypothetical protein VIY29_13735 [Ktedonobacteraceae bacterium]